MEYTQGMTEEEKQALMRAIAQANEEAGSDGDEQSIDLESPALNPAKSGRTVPYSPSKEHMSATVESHGTTIEQKRPSILRLQKERTTVDRSSSDQDGSAKFY